MKKIYLCLALFVMFAIFTVDEVLAQGWTDDGTVVRLTTSSDNVGIGTTSPGQKLHVLGKIRTSDPTDPTLRGDFYTASDGHVYLDAYRDSFPQYTPLHLRFSTLDLSANGVGSINIDSSGKVGIGTTSPSVLLHNNGDFITKGPWVDVRAYSSFPTALAAIGTSKKALLIPDAQAVSSNQTVPSNVTLLFLQGGTLNISTGVTITINGHVDAGLYQIFEGSGSVSFGSGSVKEVYPQWWGADPTGSTISDLPIKKASTAAANGNINLFFSPGTYLLDGSQGTNGAIEISSKITIMGAGINEVTIKASSSLNKHLFYVTANGVKFSGLSLDGTLNATGTLAAIYFNETNDTVVTDCYVKGKWHWALKYRANVGTYGNNVVERVESDSIIDPVSGIGTPIEFDGGVTDGVYHFESNRIYNSYIHGSIGGIFFAGNKKSLAIGNYLIGKVGSDIGIDCSFTEECKIIGNIVKDYTNWGIAPYLKAYRTIVDGNTIKNCGAASIVVGRSATDIADGSVISNNVMDNGIQAQGSYIVIQGNTITDSPTYGIQAVLTHSSITDNIIKNSTLAGIRLGDTTYTNVIGNNIFDAGVAAGVSGIDINGPTASHYNNIIGNVLRANSGYGITENNGVLGSQTDKNYYELNVLEGNSSGNRIADIAANSRKVLNVEGVNSVGFSASVTLTANQATTVVSNSDVRSGSRIILFPTTANAASEIGNGTIYISAKTTGTSFTITHANNGQADRTFDYIIMN